MTETTQDAITDKAIERLIPQPLGQVLGLDGAPLGEFDVLYPDDPQAPELTDTILKVSLNPIFSGVVGGLSAINAIEVYQANGLFGSSHAGPVIAFTAAAGFGTAFAYAAGHFVGTHAGTRLGEALARISGDCPDTLTPEQYQHQRNYEANTALVTAILLAWGLSVSGAHITHHMITETVSKTYKQNSVAVQPIVDFAALERETGVQARVVNKARSVMRPA